MLRTHWGMMFQQGALFSALSVYDNIAQPFRELGKMPEDLIRDVVMLKLKWSGCRASTRTRCRRRSPAGWSSAWARAGDRARAGAAVPRRTDRRPRSRGRPTTSSTLIATLHRALGLTVVMVTHDLDTLVALSTRIAVLADRRALVAAPVEEAVAVDHPFIREYFSAGADAARCRRCRPSAARGCRPSRWKKRRSG